jgi:hypothetical protein
MALILTAPASVSAYCDTLGVWRHWIGEVLGLDAGFVGYTAPVVIPHARQSAVPYTHVIFLTYYNSLVHL